MQSEKCKMQNDLSGLNASHGIHFSFFTFHFALSVLPFRSVAYIRSTGPMQETLFITAR
jgi:hypothetical protein